jgi:hypothetical protein
MQIYYPDTRIYKRIIYLVTIKQDGLCQACRRPFAGNEPIARSDTRTARYYHYGCAERRRIDGESAQVFSASLNSSFQDTQ